jgi:hypothetical protein
MSVKIVLPEVDGIKVASGTRVYTESGHEIENICRIEIDLQPDSIIAAKITVPVSDIENLEGIEGLIIAKQEDAGL